MDVRSPYFNYHFSIALLLSIILIPSISGILFDDLLWFYALSVKKLKWVVLGVILYYEAKLTKFRWYKNVVILAAVGMVIDSLFKIMHWPNIIIGLKYIPLLFFVFALVIHWKKKDRPFYHLLFLTYIPLMFLHLNFRMSETLWWCDFLLTLIIWIVSFIVLFRKEKVDYDN